ncbi:hypothetical protein [Haloarchaeobius sp. HRN-SO-5]|uniref:hypothetical protein n=1 Tax=Haloarchaeobius sp. HRN-SO-5 TaxID=3446118 RepID=UPI003EBB26A8
MVPGDVSTVDHAESLGSVPTFFALDAYAVVQGARRGASVQLDESYFDGQRAVLEALDSSTDVGPRVETLRQSRRMLGELGFQLDSLCRRDLLAASDRLLDGLRTLPELTFLRRHVPGTCFVVPDWSRTGSQVRYGARVYVFGDGDAPDPEDVVRENVEAVVEEDPGRFDRYRGVLHGYPECCVEHYRDRHADDPSPERRSMRHYEDLVDDDIVAERRDPGTSVEDIVPALFDADDAFAFFSREFFPEPDCEDARRVGGAVYDVLVDAYPESLVRDHFRLNLGFSYLMSRAAVTGATTRPPPGLLGREHRYSYLPSNVVASLYRSGRV